MHRLSASNKATQKSKPTNTKKINLAVKSKKNASKKAAETSKFSMTTTTTTTTQTRPALAINAQDVLAAYDRIKCMFSTCFDFLPSFIYLLFFPPTNLPISSFPHISPISQN